MKSASVNTESSTVHICFPSGSINVDVSTVTTKTATNAFKNQSGLEAKCPEDFSGFNWSANLTFYKLAVFGEALPAVYHVG